MLQNQRLLGLKFTRQKPLDEFIVDFYCAELMVAIEIDGDSHAEQLEYDARRTERLRVLGILLLRYDNGEVLGNLDGVYADIVEAIEKR